MCEYCAAIKLAECFRTPAEYEQTIAYIRCLVQEQGFVFEGGIAHWDTMSMSRGIGWMTLFITL